MTPPFAIQGPSLLGATLTIARSSEGVAAVSASSAFDARTEEQLNNRVRALRGALEALRQHETSGVRAGLSRAEQIAAARSRWPLALKAVATFTTMTSSQEVNVTPTSFTPFGPDVSGNSTTLPTLGGVYSGAQGDDTLTFEFRHDRTVGGLQPLNVRVYDGTGQRIDTLRFAGVATDTPIALSNGLTLSLSAGDAERNDTFTVDVSASVGSQVDPTQPFNGTRNENPNFELGVLVTAGSFEVNGVQINVAADDSVNSVLAKITNSAAGVSAAYDAATDSVVLTQQTPGSAPTISLTNDSSGFLAATKLTAASAIPGQDAQDPVGQPIVDVPALDAIQSGTFSVNGIELAVDIDTDTLGDVLDRINAAGAGVDARLDPESLILSFTSLDPSDALVLEDGTSGFFSGVQVTPATYEPRATTKRTNPGFTDLDRVRRDMFEVRRTLDALLTSSSGSSGRASNLREGLREAIGKSFERLSVDASSSILRSGFGIDFDFGSQLEIAEFSDARFRAANKNDFEALHGFLFGSADAAGEPGLIDDLIAKLDALQGGGGGGLTANLGRIVDLFT